MFLVSKTLAGFADFDGPDGPKFDVRARGFLALPPPAGGQGAAPSGARFAPLRVVIPPAVGLGRVRQRQGCASPVLAILAMLALRAVRGSGLLRAALDPAPSLKTRLRASQSLVDTFKRAFRGHRAPNSPRRASTASRRAFWACMVFTSSASVVSRVGASSQPVRL